MRHRATEIGDRWNVDLRFEEVEHIAPMTVSKTGRALAAHLVSAAGELGWHLELEDNRGGVSFPNFLPDPAALSVIDGLGPVGGGMHTREEYLEIESLRRRIALIAEALIFIRDHRRTGL